MKDETFFNIFNYVKRNKISVTFITIYRDKEFAMTLFTDRFTGVKKIFQHGLKIMRTREFQ